METIFKYVLNAANVQMIEMPEGATVLTLQVQHESPCVWVKVDPDAPAVKRRFVTYGTGHPCDDGPAKHYVGTYQVRDGALVYHVFTDGIEYPKDA